MSPSFTGTEIGSLRLESLISDGTFAQVYRAKHVETDDVYAVKIARVNQSGKPRSALPDESQGLEWRTGAVVAAWPDPRDLLDFQISISEIAGQDVFPKFGFRFEDADQELFGYSMEFINGTTLNRMIETKQASLDHVIAIAESLQQLLSISPYHGDLKPANVIFDGMKVRLLDPGFFGEMRGIHGETCEMKVTTPLYYPLLEPDDLLALGMMTWEVVFGHHPLKNLTAQNTQSLISEELRKFISNEELCGQYYLSPIVSLPHPVRLIPKIPLECQNILLKLLRLSLIDNQILNLDTGYKDITEVSSALGKLRQLTI